MIVLPCVIFVCTYLLYHYEILPDNPLMYFVLQVETFAPPALNSLIVISVVYPEGTETSSTILFWAHVIAVFTMTIGICVAMFTL